MPTRSRPFNHASMPHAPRMHPRNDQINNVLNHWRSSRDAMSLWPEARKTYHPTLRPDGTTRIRCKVIPKDKQTATLTQPHSHSKFPSHKPSHNGFIPVTNSVTNSVTNPVTNLNSICFSTLLPACARASKEKL